MSLNYYFPEGTKLYYSVTFAGAKDLTIVSNANPALATSVGHGYADGDIVLLDSGWEDASNNVYKIDQQSVDTFQLLGLDSSDTDWYAAGAGVGTTQKITGWVEIPGALNIQTSGGDPRYTQIDLLAKRNSISVPTGFNPTNMTVSMVWDPADATYQAMLGIARTLTPVAFKLLISGGAVAYGRGFMAASEVPSLNRNQVNAVNVGMTLTNRLVAYAS